MPLLQDNRFEADAWQHLQGDTDIPADGDLLVPLARLLSDFQKLSSRSGRLGVILPNSERASVLETFLPALSLIALDFPAFADGRAYSQARHLRQHGFAGELRARGNVLPDQLAFMTEVGFDAFEVSDRFSEQAWQAAASRITLRYQDTQRPLRQHIWHARHSAANRRLASRQ